LYYLKREVLGAYEKYRYCGNGKGPDPCDKRFYKVLDDADRAEGFVTGSVVKCDRESADAATYNRWNRFNGSAGVVMSTKCVDTMRCGAKAPGWLFDGHPRVAEGVVIRTVCYHWADDCCYYKNDIQVKNCGGYFVYKFERPPASNLRYCGNGTGPPPSNEVCEHKMEERANPCITGDYIELSEPDRAAGHLTNGYARSDQRDLAEEQGWYRFTGKAGTRMAKKCVPTQRCGASATGWLNGSHPEDEDEGVVIRTVCFHWKNDCCHWKVQVKVRNCGGFYLYYLKRDPFVGDCSYRYCGNGQGPTPTQAPTTQVTTEEKKTTKQTERSPTPMSPTPSQPPSRPEVNVTCGKNEMSISIPKYLLPALDREHLRLTDVNCGAQETNTHYILHTNLMECQTVSRHNKDFVCYMNKVLEIPVKKHQIITRVREVEIPFSCYYSNMGVVSAVGLQVKSKKIIFSKKGYGKFVLEMKIFPDGRFLFHYKKQDFPVNVALRDKLFVEVSVDTQDTRLEILAEECFATPDSDPNKPGLKYTFIKDGCKIDDTVSFIPTVDKTSQRFSLEAFKFLGDHQFVFMHCKVKICNATNPTSRCAKGCLQQRRKRSLDSEETKDEEYRLAQGPFMRKEVDEQDTKLKDSIEGLQSMPDIKGQENSPLIIVSALSAALCLMGMSYMLWSSKKRNARGYRPVNQAKLD